MEHPSRIGAYRLLEPLGQGGMGVVYRAEHEATGQLVALKTVRIPNANLLQSIRREIHALARRRHPNIVRIVEQGVHEGMPWYAMQLLPGVSLRRRMPHPRMLRDTTTQDLDAPTRSVTLPQTSKTGSAEGASPLPGFGAEPQAGRGAAPSPRQELTGAKRRAAEGTPSPGPPWEFGASREFLVLVRRLCGALAYLHGEGLVHRDLKPDNIMALPTGEPVLVDFGLAAAFAAQESRENLEFWTLAAGTLNYMAPEQLLGEFVDARADLYSLGCILFEMLAGRPPFLATSPAELARLQLDPPRVSEFARNTPQPIEGLISRLLIKDRRARIGYAADLARQLDEILGSEPMLAAAPPPRAYLYRPELAGRAKDLAEIQRWLERLAQGSGGLLLLGGESGAGKTRLLLEASRKAVRHGIRPWMGECPERPLRPMDGLRRPLQALLDLCRQRGPEATLRLLGRQGRLLGQIEPGFLELPGLAELPEAPELPPDAARERLFLRLAQSFGALSREAPLLFLLDDLQWLDPTLAEALEFMLRRTRLTSAPVLILGAYRQGEAGASLRRLLEAPDAHRLELGRLEDEAIASMARDMLALDEPATDFGGLLARSSEGNPFFVAEYLRAAVEEGRLQRDEQGRWRLGGLAESTGGESLPLPSSLLSLVERRLAALPPAAAHVAELASVLGREPNLSLLAAMFEGTERELDDALAELRRARILEEDEEDSGRGLRFAHDKLREGAYARLPDARRAELHRRAALYIEALGGEPELMPELGRHWELSGEPIKARAAYLASARQAVAGYAREAAGELYRACLRLCPEPCLEGVAAHQELGGRVLRMQGRIQEAMREHETAHAQAELLGDRHAAALALDKLGVLHAELGELEGAARFHDRALEAFRRLGARSAEAEVLMNLAVLNTDLSKFEEACCQASQALRLFRELGKSPEVGKALSCLAILEHCQGRLSEARDLYEQALSLNRATGDTLQEASTLGNLALLLADRKQYAEARPLLERALELHREVGNRRSEGHTLSSLCLLLLNLGQTPEAWSVGMQALELHRELGDRTFEGVTLGNLAGVRSREGKPAEALELLERALGIHRDLKNQRVIGQLLMNMAENHRLLGDFQAAEMRIEEAEEIWRAMNAPMYRIECLCERGYLELDQGRSADEALERARSLAREAGLEAEPALLHLLGSLERAQADRPRGAPHPDQPPAGRPELSL